MSEFYRTTYSSDARRKHRSVVGIIADVLFFVLTVAVVVLFVLTLFVPRLDPRVYLQLAQVQTLQPG